MNAEASSQRLDEPGHRSAIVTVAFGHSTEHLDHTFSSFVLNRGMPLHAFIIGPELPKRRVGGIEYHLVAPIPDFSDPLREIYFRRLELIDALDVDYALVVDSYDVLCCQALPDFSQLLGHADVAACVEHQGSRYVLGQGYTSNFLNGGVFFWNVPRSRDIRAEVAARGRSHFRTVADDQHCLNEVIQTKYFDRLRILPSQYNYRCNLSPVRQRGWPTVEHLDGVMLYHNTACMAQAKKMLPVRPRAALPPLAHDQQPLNPRRQLWRKIQNRMTSWVVK
jgi:hypothetical protein